MNSALLPFAVEYVTFIRRILSVAETGRPEWDPSAVYIYADDNRFNPPRKQITLSIGFTESGSNLSKVISRYCKKTAPIYAAQFATYLPTMGRGESLWNNSSFINLLKAAGKDPPMAETQKELFDELYLNPAFIWASTYGFSLPLSYLVIADSFLHSGSMLGFLMNRFPEGKPVAGGEEMAWIKAYVRERRAWLAGHSNKILRNTVYRVDCYQSEIKRENWTLTESPVVMNMTPVHLV